MITVIASSISEATLEQVMEWIHEKGETVHRINSDFFLDGRLNCPVNVSNDTSSPLLAQDWADTISTTKAVWFWRWGHAFNKSMGVQMVNPTLPFKDQLRLSSTTLSHLNQELASFQLVIEQCFDGLPSLNPGGFRKLNKVAVLNLARKLGILIPPTIVATKKRDLQKFMECHGSVICKAISEGFCFFDESHSYFMYTTQLTPALLEEKTETFLPLFAQKEIKKEFEIRSFYLDGRFYSMAIFSQESEKTTVDFRDYDFGHPNRTVPYKLPSEVEEKLTTLMSQLNLSTGSLDLIMTPNGHIYFLEVNPAGQFGMVSTPCNYYLEEKIAEALLNRSQYE